MRNKEAAKKSSFGADLIEGMKLVAAHQRGEIELEQVWPKPIDVKAIRKRVYTGIPQFGLLKSREVCFPAKVKHRVTVQQKQAK